jgi:hypothetical protein
VSKSIFTDEQVAAMPRKHALEHPWQRGYRNHKRIKEFSRPKLALSAGNKATALRTNTLSAACAVDAGAVGI